MKSGRARKERLASSRRKSAEKGKTVGAKEKEAAEKEKELDFHSVSPSVLGR